ncbi:DUF5000 domain-containing lipoprotein [Niabella aurantiaca]|uniref:DUF5000 domain-containing lipoprotein n=1 Tax=Niabella aurantiaca TaxID=379900 RepID=UPI0003A5B1CC|nr:DUF5000 domain-containing lipoprotein [Niabella aurantiaca]
MYKQKVLFLLFCCSLFTILGLHTGCKEDIGIEPARLGAKPSPLTNLRFESTPGGAVISYNLPNDPDLRYVMAEYTLENGAKMTSKASVYDNRVLVQGFARIGQNEVVLKAVSVGDVASDPVSIIITTGQPNYITIAKSFESDTAFYATFGGVNAKYLNEDAENIVIRIFKWRQDSTTGEYYWASLNETYTKAIEGTIRVRDQRGQEPVTTDYAVIVRDQWKNVSDTIVRRLTPLAETEFKDIKVLEPPAMAAFDTATNLNGDYTVRSTASNGESMQKAFFDGTPANPIGAKQWWGLNAPLPMQFTLDLGEGNAVQLSNIKLWSRITPDNLYKVTHIKEFELYASNDPASDGSWDSWTYISTCFSFRPSGLAYPTEPTAEDIAYAKAGEDFEVDWPNANSYRYFRIKITSMWDGARYRPIPNSGTICLAELKLFGR